MIDFNKLIDNYLKRELRPRTPGKYYPSESGNCLRKAYYSYKDPKDFDVDILKIFEAGNIVHDLVAKVINSGKNPDIDLLATESPVFLTHGDFVISGRMDGVLLVRLDSKIYILEVKSVSSLNYVKEAKPAHVSQLQLYMKSTGIHDGLMLYIDRSTLKSNIFKIRFDPSIVESTLNRFAKLHSHIKHNSLPEPEARILKKDLGWQCAKCQYKEACYKENPASIEIP